MSKHTPGPWAIYVNAPSDVVIRKMSKDGCELCAIARVSSGYANAHLIAAAPELLEACLAITEWGDREDDHAVDLLKRIELCELAFQKARAAIAKATGENT